MINRSLLIVPNDDVLVETYGRDLEGEADPHGMVIEELSNEFNLGYTCESVGLFSGLNEEQLKNNYNGYNWSLFATIHGHVIIQFDDLIVIYLPEKLTIKQYKWLKKNKKNLSKYKNAMQAFSVRNIDSMDILQVGIFQDESNFRKIYEEIELKEISVNLKEKRGKSL